MIKSFYISNFKSIDKIDLHLNNFTCLVGLNGSGKSTILQAVDFITQVLQGSISSWLQMRGWHIKDITNKNFRNRRTIELGVELYVDNNTKIFWNAKFDTKLLKCTFENINFSSPRGNKKLLLNGKLLEIEGVEREIIWEYEGSIISSLSNFDQLPEYIRYLRDFASKASSLELLSPAVLRKRSRANSGKIGIGGEKLAGYLFDLKIEQRNQIIQIMRDFYPNLAEFEIKSAVGGWKHLIFDEIYTRNSLKTFADHTNDGILRILAIITQIQTSNASLVLLDEIENGINQEIMDKLVGFLLKSKIQVIATTHSPLFLNQLDDDVAQSGVYFIYRKEDGNIGLKKFFSIIDEPAMLNYAGPGEVYANTDLLKLAKKLSNFEDN